MHAQDATASVNDNAILKATGAEDRSFPDETAASTFAPDAPAQDAAPTTPEAVPEERLYTYVIMREDLGMDAGKLASQAVHAGRLSLLHYLKNHPERIDEFLSLNSCGSVVVLKAKNLSQIEKAWAQAVDASLPTAMFADSGHIPVVWIPDPATDGETRIKSQNNHFTGDPIVTALGIGPCTKDEARSITKRFNCV